MQLARFRFNSRAFTLVEMLIVLSIIALLAALTMGGYTYAMRSSKRRLTQGTFEAVKLALERYNTDFGEYPEPNSQGQQQDFVGGKKYNVSGAACLYQAITGDGYDQIKGVSAASSSSGSGGGSSSGSSDGKVEGAEVQNKKMAEIPQTIWTNKNGTYIIIDGFGHPFQYIKATPVSSSSSGSGSGSSQQAQTINSTYDLWSYGEDETNITTKSVDTLEKPGAAAKWIKNW